MKTFFAALVMLTMAGMMGCETKPAPPMEQKSKIEVNAPGVKVDVEPGKGVQVEAPGVEVDTKPKN